MKIGFVSLGCPKNLVDGEVMLGLAREAGHEITANAHGAEVIVVNTCAFIDNAKEESVDAILEMAQLKRDGSCKKLIVTGCLAERYREQLQKEIPEIDVCLGTGEVPDIVGAIANQRSVLRVFRSRGELSASPGTQNPTVVGQFDSGDQSDAEPRRRDAGATATLQGVPLPSSPRLRARSTQAGWQTDSPANPSTPAVQNLRTPPTYLYDASTPRVLTTPGHYAYIKIGEGCDYTCAFCIIPTLRGGYRSRDEDSVVREAEQLAAQGVQELLLISQDTSFFGLDKKKRGALASLLRRLNDVHGLRWIRMLYLYPTTITDDVLEAMAECERVCKYVDLPLQHASADVLRRMRRPGNREAYDKLLARVRRMVPGVTLRTTFIVGFPGETAQDFEELCAFVRDTGFDHVGVFTYSHEEGTRAFELVDDVPAAVKRARRDTLMRLQKQIVRKRQKSRLGDLVEVMVDGPSADSDLVLQGRLQGQAPDIDPVVYLSECDPSAFEPGSIISARVTGSKDYDLIVTAEGALRRADITDPTV